LAELAAVTIESRGADVDRARMSDFDCPSYNLDVQSAGFPAGAEVFSARLDACDGFVITAPEYNASMPGPEERDRLGIARTLGERQNQRVS
jgi:chromate reductase